MPVSDDTRDVTGEGKCERFNTFLWLELFVSFRFLHFLHQRQTKATHSHKHSSNTAHAHTHRYTWGKRRQNRQTTRKKCRLAQLIKTRNSFSFFLCCCCFSFFCIFSASSLLTAVWLKYAWFPKLRLCSAVSSTRYCWWCCCLYLNVFTRFLTLFLFLFLSLFLSQVNCTTLSASKATLWRIR